MFAGCVRAPEKDIRPLSPMRIVPTATAAEECNNGVTKRARRLCETRMMDILQGWRESSPIPRLHNGQ